MHQVYFIRHLLGTQNNQELFDQELIAIDYSGGLGIDSILPSDHDKSVQKYIIRFNKLSQTGGLVAAKYSGIKKKGSNEYFSGYIVGSIKIGSIAGKTLTSQQKVKTIQLEKVKYLEDFSSYPSLLTTEPRGGTFCQWPVGARAIISFYQNSPLPCNPYSLSDSQIEVLCHEYLMLENKIESLLLPIGRTMKAVDIWGVNSKGENVIAQVTFGNSIKEKINALSVDTLKKIEHKYLFAPMANLKNKIENGISCISIEDVFNSLLSKKRNSLLKMLPACSFGAKQYSHASVDREEGSRKINPIKSLVFERDFGPWGQRKMNIECDFPNQEIKFSEYVQYQTVKKGITKINPTYLKKIQTHLKANGMIFCLRSGDYSANACDAGSVSIRILFEDNTEIYWRCPYGIWDGPYTRELEGLTSFLSELV